jgi:hypothetical protein
LVSRLVLSVVLAKVTVCTPASLVR